MINVVNKFKQIVAVVILVSMVVASNGFSTLAASSVKVEVAGSENTSSVLLPKAKEAGTYYDQFGTSLFHYESKTLLYGSNAESNNDNETSDDNNVNEKNEGYEDIPEEIEDEIETSVAETTNDDTLNDSTDDNETTESINDKETDDDINPSIEEYTSESEEEESEVLSDNETSEDTESSEYSTETESDDKENETETSSENETNINTTEKSESENKTSDIEPIASESETDEIYDTATDSEIEEIISLKSKKASDSILYGADPVHTHKICGLQAGTACEHTYTAAHSNAITYTKITTMKEMNEAFAAGGNYYLGADITYTSAINPSPNFAPLKELNICLNGFTLIRVTFKGSKNIVNITNCSTTATTLGDGATEDAEGVMQNTRSTYLAEDIDVNIYGVTVDNASNLNMKYSLLYKGGENNATLNVYNTNLTEGDALNVNNYNYIHQVASGSITFEKNVFTNLTGLKGFLYTEAGSANGTIIFDNNTISNVETVSNFMQLNSNELIFKNENTISNNTFGLKQNSSFIEMLYGSKINFDENSTTTLSSNTISGYGIIGFININNAVFYLSETATLNIQNNFATHNQSTTYVGWFKFTNRYLDAKILGKINITGSNMQHDYTEYSDDFYIPLVYADNTIALGPNAAIYMHNDYIKNTSGANITTVVSNDTSLMAYLFNPLANWRTGGREFDLNNIEDYAAMVTLRDSIGLFKNATDEKINPSTILLNFGYIGFTANGLYNGVVMMQFDENTIVDWTDTLYKTAFPLYYLANYKTSVPYNSYVFDQTTGGPETTRKLRAMKNNHVHKLCGVTGNCAHTLAAAHPAINNDTDRYLNIVEYLGPYSMTQGKYFLPTNFATASVTTIFLTGDLYLCLNGHSVSNFNFITTYTDPITAIEHEHTVYICNCTIERTAVSNITIDSSLVGTDTYGLNSSGQVVPIAYSDLGPVPYLGYGSVEVYSYNNTNNMVQIQSDRLMYADKSTAHLSFYKVGVTKFSNTYLADTNAYVNVKSAETFYVESVYFARTDGAYQLLNIE